MTYDPDRDVRAPRDVNPNTRPYERAAPGVSVALMLGLMVAFIAVGFWFTMHGNTPVATDDRPATERTTTGAGSQQPPLPSTPTPPTVPPQPRE